jgi:Flp pilus assembly protein TadD
LPLNWFRWSRWRALALLVVVWFLGATTRICSAANPPEPSCVVLDRQGKVEVALKGSAAWKDAQVNDVLHPGDRLRTGSRSRATLRWSELSVVRVNELTSMELQPPQGHGDKAQMDLKSGGAYFFSREKPTEIQFKTPVASGAIRGTEFNLDVAEDGRTVLSLLDGAVDMANAQGSASFKSGEQGTVTAGSAPSKTAMIDAAGPIQWALYYPAVVDPEDLNLGGGEKDALKDSLQAYKQGDLLGALAKYPEGRTAGSDAERTYHAAVLLAAGRVDQAESALKNVSGSSAGANALKEVIATVKRQAASGGPVPSSGSEWMARSYFLQSRGQLSDALTAARNASMKSPSFGAAYIRQAELEFGFGHNDAALDALNRGLAISPRNAQGLALKGFMLAAKNDEAGAMDSFNQAIAADGSLPTAWLGRGLMKIRQGYIISTLANYKEGREDLQVAATLDPQRSVLRSYLGKAFSQAHDLKHARKELDMAKQLDPNDPTSWLYMALLNQQDNRVNEAVQDLEKSKELNQNRSVFRSQFMLDQDQAVRGANLASMYRDDGMTDFGSQEASRAVNNDYGNYSAHLFLANSYDALRDPNNINLRYDAPWFSELLVANLLAPVSGGSLSQNISQQEYSKLFASDGLGVFSMTEYSSRGDWNQNGSQYGIFDNSSYSIDAHYRNQNGFRPNNDLRQLDLAARFKQQLTDKDSIFVQATYFDADEGDLAQYYNQTNASKTLRVTEEQKPSMLFGYHREWAPGSHTLFLWSRIDDTLTLNDTDPALLFLRTFVNPFTGATNVSLVNPAFFNLNYTRDLTANSFELQQIWQNPMWTTIVGARYQVASADTTDNLDRVPPFGAPTPVHVNDSSHFDRFSAYYYQHWQPIESLRLIGGVSYDRVEFPLNIDTSPITSGSDTEERFSPKAGILWTPLPDTHVRAAYTRSLGGVFFENSVQLEPTEIAGFNQTFRSVIPESVAGLVPGTKFETWGIGVDQKFKTGTYLLVQGEILGSDAVRTVGLLTNSDTTVPIADSASSTRQSLEYQEESLIVALNQLVGKEWAVGARYKLTHADLDQKFLDLSSAIPGSGGFNSDTSARLNQLDLYAIYQVKCGFFAQFDAVWSQQSNYGYSTPLPGDDFWQYNVYAGYRFLQRRAEVRFGVLNLTDRDYKLNPLTLYNELPRERTFTVSLKLNF